MGSIYKMNISDDNSHHYIHSDDRNYKLPACIIHQISTRINWSKKDQTCTTSSNLLSVIPEKGDATLSKGFIRSKPGHHPEPVQVCPAQTASHAPHYRKRSPWYCCMCPTCFQQWNNCWQTSTTDKYSSNNLERSSEEWNTDQHEERKFVWVRNQISNCET